MRIRAKNVRKAYDEVIALDGLTVEIPAGSTFGLLGTNGAGKTTLFKLLVGHDRPDAGRLEIGGADVTEAGRRIRERVGYLPERVGFPPALTGREVLSFHARMRGLPSDGRIETALDRVGLAVEDADRQVSGYSNGMRRRLGLATVLLADPEVLILDEPTAGLDPRGVAEFHRIVERVQSETDATVVFCSHVLSEVERLCDRVAILHDGRVLAEGRVEDLVAGETTVRLSVENDFDAALETVGSVPGTTVSGDEGRATVRCDADRLPALFEALSGHDVSVASIDRPGLEGTFRDRLVRDAPGDTVEDAPGDTAENAPDEPGGTERQLEGSV
ncbi:MAG: ABC transporter ATP-binding protein [Haloferacaceae archaeon]